VSKENGFVPIRRGILEHIQDGRLTPLEFTAHYLITSQADTRTGKWIGSAKCIASALCITERLARRVLENLSRGDYIRRFPVPGKHVCYPILVHKFHPTSGEHKGEQLDAISSLSPTDLRYSQIDSGELVGEHIGEHVTSQKRSEKGEGRKKKEEAAARLAGGSELWNLINVRPEKMPGAFRELCEQLYANKNGQPLAEFVGVCMDGWEALGGKSQPREFAQAASRIREQEKNPPARPIKFLPELPFQTKKAWPCQPKN
jgi:hypothetical protein